MKLTLTVRGPGCSSSMLKAAALAAVRVSGTSKYCYTVNCFSVSTSGSVVSVVAKLNVDNSRSTAKNKIAAAISNGKFVSQWKSLMTKTDAKAYSLQKGSLCIFPSKTCS